MQRDAKTASGMADLHTHTALCKHADGSPEEYLRAAEAAGLAFLGVSDHCPWPDGYDAQWRMSPAQFPEYRDIVSRLKRAASDSPVKVLYGLEVDWVPGRMDEVWNGIEGESFDYLLGSVHYLDGFQMDSPYERHRWAEHGGPGKIWMRYAECLCEYLLSSGRFDVIAHPDLPKKFAMYPASMEPFRARMADAFDIAASKSVALELNTAGLRKPAKEIYPSLELLKMAKDAGLAICLGSDAHTPSEVGFAFRDAVELAKAAGFRTHLAFDCRRRVELSLPD